MCTLGRTIMPENLKSIFVNKADLNAPRRSRWIPSAKDCQSESLTLKPLGIRRDVPDAVVLSGTDMDAQKSLTVIPAGKAS